MKDDIPDTAPVLLRIFNDADGESSFEDVPLSGETRRSSVSTSTAWWSDPVQVRSLVWRQVVEEAPPSIPHNAPRRQLIVPLSGSIEIEVSSGECRRVDPGQMILVEDTTGKGHITRSLGEATRVTLMLELGDEPVPAAVTPRASDVIGLDARTGLTRTL